MKSKQQKRDESNRFGQMFVSCSRVIAQQTETHRRIEQENKLKSITLQTTSETYKVEKESSHLSKERMIYMQSQKIRISWLDKVITEYKRQKMKDEGMQKIHAIIKKEEYYQSPISYQKSQKNSNCTTGRNWRCNTENLWAYWKENWNHWISNFGDV